MYVMLEQYHFLKCEEQFFSSNIINSPYRGLTRNLAKTTAASPFMYIFLATNLRQGIDGDIEIMLLMIVQNMSCFKRLLMFDLKFI